MTDQKGRPYTNTFVVDYPLAGSSSDINVGPATHLVFTTMPSSTAVAGVPFSVQPVLEVENDSGQPVSTDLSPVVLSLTVNGTGATLAGCSGNEVAGVITFTGCDISAAGTYTLGATDGNLSTDPSTNPTITVSGSTAPYLVFTTQPVGGNSGSTLATQPVVKVYVGANTLDTGYSGTVTLTSSGGVLSGCSTITVTNGVGATPSCTFQGGYLYDPISQATLAIPYTLYATASGVTSATSNTFTVSGAGPAAQLQFTTQPTGVANASPTAAFTTQPAVTVEDAFGNVVTTFNGTIGLTLNGGTLGGCSQSASKGVVTFSGCHGSAYGTGFTLTASYGALPTVNSNSFNITGVASNIAFTTQPVAAGSGSVMTTQPVITIYDSSNRVVTAASTPVSLGTSGGSLTLCTNLSPVSGVITVNTCTFAGKVGTNYTMTATIGALTATSQTFSPTSPGIAAQLVYAVQPVAGASQSPFTTQPVIDVEDSAGNIVTSSNDSLINPVVSGGTLAGCANLTAVAGVVNVSSCAFTGLVGTNYTLTFTANLAAGTTSVTSSTFSPSGPGPASQIVLTGCSTAVKWNTSCTATATEKDMVGNVETGYVGAITFTQTGGTGGVSGLGAISAVAGVSNDTLTGSTVGTLQVTASVGPIVSSPLSITVTLATQTVSFYTDGTYTTTTTGGAITYSPSGTYMVYAKGSAGGTITFSASGSCTVNSGTGLVTLVSGAPQSCTVTATAAPIGNYASGQTTFALTINKAPNSVTITSTAPPSAVVGGPMYTPTATATSGDVVAITSTTPSVCTISGGVVSFVTAGSCSLSFTDNPTYDYLNASNTQTFSVGKGTQAALVVTSTTGTFGTALTLTTSGGSGTGAVTYAAVNGTATGCTVSGTTPYKLSSASAGTCLVTATKAGDANYNAISSSQTTVTMNTAQLTVTANNQNLTYTGSPAVADGSTVSGLQGTDAATVTSATYTYTGTGGTTYGPSTTRPTNAGTYSVAPSAATLSFSSGSASNYNATYTYAAGTLTIGKATLTVTANNQTLAYTGSPVVADASAVSGLLGTDAANVTSATYTYTGTGGTTYGPSTTRPTHAGTYSVTPSAATVNFTSGSATNYSATYTYAAGTLTVNKAQLTVTANDQSPTYTGVQVVADGSVVSGLQGTDAANVTSATYTYTGTGATTYGPSTTRPTSAGTYSVTPSAATLNFTTGQAADYNATYTYVAGSLTINPAVLTVTANNQSPTYTGSPAVADGSTVSGLQGTDAATVTSATYTYTGTGGTTYGPSTTRPTNAGTYSVAPSAATLNFSSGSAANYFTPYTYASGTLTINKATLTVTAGNQNVTYTGNPAPADSSTPSGFLGTDAANVTSATYTYTGTGGTTYGPSTTIPTGRRDLLGHAERGDAQLHVGFGVELLGHLHLRGRDADHRQGVPGRPHPDLDLGHVRRGAHAHDLGRVGDRRRDLRRRQRHG